MTRWRGLLPLAVAFLLGLAGVVLPGPLGDIAAFVWVGVFPGLALVRLLLPGAPTATRWTLGLALAPLASALVGWALLQSGQPIATASRLIGIAGWLLFMGGEARALTASHPDEPGPDRTALRWLLVAVAFVAVPMLLNPYLRVRSDGWVHAGIALEVLERGLPPQDPRFAGLTLNYVWFYNLFTALLLSLRPGSSPFTHMAVANAVWMGTLVAVVWQLAWTLGRDRAAAARTLPLFLTGLNAGALLLWPLWLLRALRGEVTGLPEVQRILASARWDSTEVLHQLCAPFAWMVNSWDKFMVGTSLGLAWTLGAVMVWAVLSWLGEPEAPGSRRWLAVTAVAAAGAMFLHSVAGLSLGPVAIGACLLYALLAARDPRLGPTSRPLLAAAAVTVGLAATLPYFRSISSGWSAERAGFEHHYLRVSWHMPWTLLTACGLIAWLAWPAIVRGVRQAHPTAVWLAAFTLGMTAFALVVHLPEDNEHKFVWQVFLPLALFAGQAWPERAATVRRRLGTPLATALLVVAFVLPALLLQRGYLADRPSDAPELARAPGEAELCQWVRERTPISAVFLDYHSRDVLMVDARRRLLVGTPHAAERAAFPAAEMARRREVMADLYGPCARLDADHALLGSLGAEAYVVYRAGDFPDSAPWTALDADSTRFELAHAADGFRVYRRRP